MSIVREVHVLSAIILVGAIVFNYTFVTPELNKIPAAYPVVVIQKVGTVFTWVGLTTLGLLLATDLTRLFLVGLWAYLMDPFFYPDRYGRWLAVMLVGWTAVLAGSLIMTFMLRPKLTHKLPFGPNPTPADVDRRRPARIAVSNLLDKLQPINLIFGVLVAVAGAPLIIGGLV
ncbi:MAG: hypothetical protein HY671_11635 [Chloroflexi bacterium]|nr:hypothetical protein [Chloroflexota bacterium]